MTGLSLVLVAQLGAAAAASLPMTRTDSVIHVARAAADSFVRNWQYHWMSSQLVQHGLGDFIQPPAGVRRPRVPATAADSIAADWKRGVPPAELRHNLVHCHPDGAVTPRRRVVDSRSGAQPTVIDIYGGWRRLEDYIIESGAGKRAICPSWFQAETPPPFDQRLRLDAALIEPFVPPVRASRRALMARLDSAARIAPTDGWLTGQRLRFALDQGDTTQARAAVASCATVDWWCSALAGYVEFVSGRIAIADSIFMEAADMMPEPERCAWMDVSSLLPPPDRQRFVLLPCSERTRLESTVWWMADPLYTEPGNERRAEHLARAVKIWLRTGTTFHELWDLRDEGGGAAAREMLLRYGWPSVAVWGGPEEDRSHLAYLNGGSFEHERFATAEYSAPRFHTFPAWRVIDDPWSARNADWVLTAAAARVVAPDDTLWWPREHYARRGGPLAQLWEQNGLFRRDSSILLAVAASLDPAVSGAGTGDTLTGALVLSAAPDSMTFLSRRVVAAPSTVVTAAIPAVRRIVSLELAGRSGTGSGTVSRARFAVSPPAPLSEMRTGDVDVSTPVFVAAPAPGSMPVTSPATAIGRMLGTTTFGPALRRVGVYWESYGVGSGDTVSVVVRIERHEAPPGTLRRLLDRLLPGGGRRAEAIAVEWREPSPERIVTTLPGRIPVQGRSVSLDLSRLSPGDYTLHVSLAREGKAAARARSARPFTIVAR